MKFIALYARVSTSDKGQTPENQLVDLRHYAKLKDWTDCTEYVDNGVSGSKKDRPALNRLMQDCRDGKIQVVIVWRLDRLFRSLKHLINTLDEFNKYDVGFISLKENIDLATASGRFLMAIMGAIAEFEREMIRERIKGAYAGNGFSKRGNKWGRKEEIVLDPINVKQTYSETKSLRKTAKVFNCSTTRIRRAL